MKFRCAICIFLNPENVICRTTDISKCFRGSLQLRDNESRLYYYFRCKGTMQSHQCWPGWQLWVEPFNQLLQLCTARTVSPDLVIRHDSVRPGKFITLMVPNENRENSSKSTTLKTEKSQIAYGALTKIGPLANINRPYNQPLHV